MVRDKGPFAARNPWRSVAVQTCLWLTIVTAVLGFVVLPAANRARDVPLWSAICTAFGLRTPAAFAARPEPRFGSDVSWTAQAIEEANSGDARKGAFVALNCAACHGEAGVNRSGWIPNLAGLRAEALVKELLDYKSGHRLWPVMNGIGGALTQADIRDVAAYYDSLPSQAATQGPDLWSSDRSPRVADPISRLVFAGDPRRGIAPCASCHGLGGVKRGAPLLAGQQASYIARELRAFQQGSRANDEGEQMRVVVAELAADEIDGLAAYLSVARH